jgi:hypothetical protein
MTALDQLSVPTSNEFEATFGCDCSIDDDLVQTCVFQDNLEQEARITFGHVDCTFGVTIIKEGEEIFRIYDEFLHEVSIIEKIQTVNIILKHGSLFQTIDLVIWPQIKISITSMK